jgi:hypothetical protein
LQHDTASRDGPASPTLKLTPGRHPWQFGMRRITNKPHAASFHRFTKSPQLRQAFCCHERYPRRLPAPLPQVHTAVQRINRSSHKSHRRTIDLPTYRFIPRRSRLELEGIESHWLAQWRFRLFATRTCLPKPSFEVWIFRRQIQASKAPVDLHALCSKKPNHPQDKPAGLTDGFGRPNGTIVFYNRSGLRYVTRWLLVCAFLRGFRAACCWFWGGLCGVGM